METYKQPLIVIFWICGQKYQYLMHKLVEHNIWNQFTAHLFINEQRKKHIFYEYF